MENYKAEGRGEGYLKRILELCIGELVSREAFERSWKRTRERLGLHDL